jgi:uncharacterized protein (TIRG00374 family)
VTDLIGVIVIITIGSASFPGGALWAALGTLAVITLLVLISVPAASNAVIERLPRLPGALGRIGHRVAPKIGEALSGLRAITAPAQLIWPTLLSVAAWSLEGLGLWVIVRGFSFEAPLGMTMFFYATATLAGALVPVPGGLGVTEKLLEEQLLRLGGVPSAISTASMMLVRFATLWFAVAVGFAALALLRARHGSAVFGGEPAPPRETPGAGLLDPSAEPPANS